MRTLELREDVYAILDRPRKNQKIEPYYEYHIFRISIVLILFWIHFMMFNIDDSSDEKGESVNNYSTLEDVNLRLEPTSKSQIIKVYLKNTEFLSNDSISNGFIMVVSKENKKIGWIHKKHTR
ncbi:hypothetical protein K8354_07230 [Polaribacter litorisediminis]|uniref:hypothetical protein n=1 Tax=Polaribacter litorisediminis TaxID=1908341 RepID=UPI001CC0131D|nr:hypothetical protein [Polaribacter litorisediminis]UAM99587.1 hypothetical protein K8354_07230 [Polaribacter litorisediminis]